MILLVVESASEPRALHARLRSAMAQECGDVTILLIEREGQKSHPKILDSIRESGPAGAATQLETLQLRDDDGLGSLLRLLRKRYKSADKIAFLFDDEEFENPHALRRMTAALTGGAIYASCGWSARDGSALRSGDVALGALPIFTSDRIDGLAVASLDALDACEHSERRQQLAEGLIRGDHATFVAEILIGRRVAAVEVEYAQASAPVAASVVTAATPATPSAEAPTTPAPTPAAPASTPAPELDDEPMLAHALGTDFADGPQTSTPPPSANAAAAGQIQTLSSGIEENVSALLEGLAPPADETPTADTGVDFSPGLSMDAETTFAGESLDDNAKALLEELAAEGRLDFEELESSLQQDDLESILFVSRLKGAPEDFKARLRKIYTDGGGDAAEFDGTKNKSLSMGDAGGDDLDDDTRAILEAAIDGPPDLSWQDEDIDGGAAAAEPEAETGEYGDKEPSDEALQAAFASLEKLEQRLDSSDSADSADSTEPEDDAGEKPSALDGWFEDFEQEEADKDSPQSADDADDDDAEKPSALDGWFEDFEQEEAGKDAPQVSTPSPSPSVEFDANSLEPDSGRGDPSSPWQADGVHGELLERARGIASQIAESLVVLQQPNGEFLESERYAKECAAALWHLLDRQLYRGPIEHAIDASRRRAEAIALAAQDDGQGPLRAYALSSIGLADDSRTALDESLCIDTLVESIIRSRRGQVIDVKRVNLVCRALDDNGTLFDRWAPEDPNASTLGVREQAFATLLAGELALRNSEHQKLTTFARKISDRLLAVARAGATESMFVAAAAYRTAERRGDTDLMKSVLDRFENSSWNGDGSSAADNYSESLAFLGLHLALDLAKQTTEPTR